MRTRKSLPLLAIGLATLALVNVSCDDGPPTGGPPGPDPTPSPPPGLSSEVIPGGHTGATEITFVAAEPPPGSTITGCGESAGGCSGAITMRFRLLSTTGGLVLQAIGFLHEEVSLAGCLRGTTGAIELEPGVPREVVIVYDLPDPNVCPTPSRIANMKTVVSGTIEVDSLQEWAIEYELLP